MVLVNLFCESKEEIEIKVDKIMIRKWLKKIWYLKELDCL